MEIAKTIPCFNGMGDLVDMLGFDFEYCNKAINEGYRSYVKFKDGKTRCIEAPNKKLKEIQRALLRYFQGIFICPPYCMAGFKGQNNIKNALRHKCKREVITSDISHYFPNTKEKYVRKFFEEALGATDEVLELLMQLTTYKGYLPTGAPTSTLLAGLVHKEILMLYTKKFLNMAEI